MLRLGMMCLQFAMFSYMVCNPGSSDLESEILNVEDEGACQVIRLLKDTVSRVWSRPFLLSMNNGV